MVQVLLEIHGDSCVVHEVRGAILLRSPVLVEDDRNLHPLLCASTKAFAIGAEVKEYAWTRISCLASLSSRTTASVAPPIEEKKTSMEGVPSGLAEI
jgi:hypothetical protein